MPSPPKSKNKKSPPQPKAQAVALQSNQSKNESSASVPLAPPPRPVTVKEDQYIPDSEHQRTEQDHLAQTRNHLQSERNPFDDSFSVTTNGNTVATTGESSLNTIAIAPVFTPGGSQRLPPLAELTASASSTSGLTNHFWASDSLRVGILSPAMLSGPRSSQPDYFTGDHHFSRPGLHITPNESGVRTGLTPGGSGSMFPEPSPNLAQFFQSGSATPGTLEFQRTALAARDMFRQGPQPVHQQNITSQPQEANVESKPLVSRIANEHHAATDAANGLYQLSQLSQHTQPSNGYVLAPYTTVTALPQTHDAQVGGQSSNTSPHNANGRGSVSEQSGRGGDASGGEMSEVETTAPPKTRGKGKKAAIRPPATKRKASTTSKAPGNKRAKANRADASEEPPSEEEPEEEPMEAFHKNGTKMNDEEKRKNFLERNRLAALKCRQRKKQWLNNLQGKVESMTSEVEASNAMIHETQVQNHAMALEIRQLEGEVARLRAMLHHHKDCNVSQQDAALNIMNSHGQIVSEAAFNAGMNPYGMAMNQQQQQQVFNAQQQQAMAQHTAQQAAQQQPN